MDLAKVIEALAEKGVDQKDIDDLISNYTKAKYEPESIAIQPAFYLESDKEVILGHERHKLRLMNLDDMRRALPKLLSLLEHVIREKELSFKSAQEMLNESTPQGTLQMVFKLLTELNLKGDYPDWFVSALEEVAALASNEQRAITAQDLISLPPSQFTQLLWKLWEVNQQDFLLLWEQVPAGLRLKIFTPVSGITSMLKSVADRFRSQAETASSGGAVSIGKPSTLSPSEPKAASRKRISRKPVSVA